jgi:hypothetical protein
MVTRWKRSVKINNKIGYGMQIIIIRTKGGGE